MTTEETFSWSKKRFPSDNPRLSFNRHIQRSTFPPFCEPKSNPAGLILSRIFDEEENYTRRKLLVGFRASK